MLTQEEIIAIVQEYRQKYHYVHDINVIFLKRDNSLMCVTNSNSIYVDYDFIVTKNMSDQAIKFCLAHEIGHIFLKHTQRSKHFFKPHFIAMLTTVLSVSYYVLSICNVNVFSLDVNNSINADDVIQCISYIPVYIYTIGLSLGCLVPIFAAVRHNSAEHEHDANVIANLLINDNDSDIELDKYRNVISYTRTRHFMEKIYRFIFPEINILNVDQFTED